MARKLGNLGGGTAGRSLDPAGGATGATNGAVIGANAGVNGGVPRAVRASRPGWRDPRLWVGLVIVAVSVVGGASLLAGADDTVPVWSVATDLGAGDRVGAEDLVATRVRFADGDAMAGYFAADEQLPEDAVLTRPVAAGELLPRGALGAAGVEDRVQVPLAVEPDQVPGSVGPGSVVDVYLLAGAGGGADPGGGAGSGRPALQEVSVVDAPPLAESFAASGKRQLVLAMEDADARRFFRLLGSLDSPVVTVVGRG